MLEAIESFRSVERKVPEKALESREKFEKRGKLLPATVSIACWIAAHHSLELCSLAATRCMTIKMVPWPAAGHCRYRLRRAYAVCWWSATVRSRGTISRQAWIKRANPTNCNGEQTPVITLAESGGANLNYATDILFRGARGFANQARMSAAGIPQVTVVHGNATAGGPTSQVFQTARS